MFVVRSKMSKNRCFTLDASEIKCEKKVADIGKDKPFGLIPNGIQHCY
jgi:hypothetical protein